MGVAVTEELVENRILLIRGKKVLIDVDLAEMYGVSTKVLNQAVKRNLERFPEDFMFQINEQEMAGMRSQIATASKRNIRYLPYAFTEHGVIMAASSLNSQRAVAPRAVCSTITNRWEAPRSQRCCA